MATPDVPDANAAPAPETAKLDLTGAAAGYRLAVTAVPGDSSAALPVLQSILGWNAIDAKIRLRQVPTIWPEELTPDVAARFVAEFRALGGEAATVPAQWVQQLRYPRVLHHIRCEADGLQLFSLDGTIERTVPWTDVALLSIAEIASEPQRSAGRLPGGVFGHDPGITAPLQRPENLCFELWMILRSPVEAVRFESPSMNYEYLGDRLASSSDENFITLVCDLVGYARQAVLTPWTRMFLNDPAHPPHALHTNSAHREAVLAHWSAIQTRSLADTEQK